MIALHLFFAAKLCNLCSSLKREIRETHYIEELNAKFIKYIEEYQTISNIKLSYYHISNYLGPMW